MLSRVAQSPLLKPADIFKCKRCGDCCIGYGGTFVTDAQIRLIADFIDMEPVQFVAEKCRMSGGKPVLAQREDGYCIFWDNHCTIYPLRPDMCRKWPFIESVLRDVTNWSIMAGSCPGIRIDVSDEGIQECVREELGRVRCEDVRVSDRPSTTDEFAGSPN